MNLNNNLIGFQAIVRSSGTVATTLYMMGDEVTQNSFPVSVWGFIEMNEIRLVQDSVLLFGCRGD